MPDITAQLDGDELVVTIATYRLQKTGPNTWAFNEGSAIDAPRPDLAGVMFVEMFSRAADPRVPDNVRTGLGSATMTGGGFAAELEIAVTGSLGGTTLTSAETAKIAGLGGDGWSGVVTSAAGVKKHVLVATDNGSSTITLRDPLPIALASGSKITPYYADALDQHRTKSGTEADAAALAAIDLRYLGRQRVFQQVSANGDDGLLSRIGTPLPFFGAAAASNLFDSGMPVRNTSLVNSGWLADTTTTGQGVAGEGDLPGEAGFIEFDVSASAVASAAGTVKLWVTDDQDDERLVIDSTYAPNVRRFLAPFEANDVSWRMEAVRTAGTGSHGLYVGELRVYQSNLSGPLFPAGSRVGVLMDSWGAYYNKRFSAVLASLYPDVTFFDYSVGGMTANWGYDWAAFHIDADNLTHLIENFAINDFNDQGSATYLDPDGNAQPLSMGADEAARTTNWIAKKKALWELAAGRGVQVISLMPPGTASQSQAQILADKATLIPTMRLGA